MFIDKQMTEPRSKLVDFLKEKFETEAERELAFSLFRRLYEDRNSRNNLETLAQHLASDENIKNFFDYDNKRRIDAVSYSKVITQLELIEMMERDKDSLNYKLTKFGYDLAEEHSKNPGFNLYVELL